MANIADRPVTVVPVVRPVDGQAQPSEASADGSPPGLEAQQLGELFTDHVSRCIDDLFDARSSAVLAYGHAGPRCQALLCMPSARPALWPCLASLASTASCCSSHAAAEPAHTDEF